MSAPLSVLKTAQNHPIMVELKNGETYNGILVNCDNWININLRNVICTSKDGDKSWKMPECYIRGSAIKFVSIPDEVIDIVKDRNRDANSGCGIIGQRSGSFGGGDGFGKK